LHIVDVATEGGTLRIWLDLGPLTTHKTGFDGPDMAKQLACCGSTACTATSAPPHPPPSWRGCAPASRRGGAAAPPPMPCSLHLKHAQCPRPPVLAGKFGRPPPPIPRGAGGAGGLTAVKAFESHLTTGRGRRFQHRSWYGRQEALRRIGHPAGALTSCTPKCFSILFACGLFSMLQATLVHQVFKPRVLQVAYRLVALTYKLCVLCLVSFAFCCFIKLS
jgi:hypothetical protein